MIFFHHKNPINMVKIDDPLAQQQSAFSMWHARTKNNLLGLDIDHELDNKMRFIRELYPNGGYVVVIRATKDK